MNISSTCGIFAISFKPDIGEDAAGEADFRAADPQFRVGVLHEIADGLLETFLNAGRNVLAGQALEFFSEKRDLWFAVTPVIVKPEPARLVADLRPEEVNGPVRIAARRQPGDLALAPRFKSENFVDVRIIESRRGVEGHAVDRPHPRALAERDAGAEAVARGVDRQRDRAVPAARVVRGREMPDVVVDDLDRRVHAKFGEAPARLKHPR